VTEAVGLVGLGQMGSAMAMNLVRAGFDVVGYDIVEDRCRELEEVGGRPVESARAVADVADRVITSLPSAAALDETVTGSEGLLEAKRRDLTVIETSTLPLDVKERNRQAAEEADAVLLDCPLSGTGSQARTKDVVVYASGDPAALARCTPVFEGFARAHHDLGAFGTGSKMKFIANLLVTIHNVAAAEAIVLAMKAGLDPQQVYDVISSGAGTSRMFEVRGALMVADEYNLSGMPARLFQKDLQIIGDFARELGCPVPLFSVSSEIHVAGVAQGFTEEDTASVCRVLERMAGVERSGDDQVTQAAKR
jgi:L-threonate 2-dehydrogenase